MTDSPPRLTRAALKERGWRPRMIDRLLGEPDQTRPNPHSRRGPPVQLFDEERVVAAEATDEFRALLEKAEQRAAAYAPSIERRRAELLRHVAGLVIEVPDRPLAVVRRLAIQSYNLRNLSETSLDDRADERTLERLTVNYIRHELTDYDAELVRLFGQIGIDAAKVALRKRVYAAIARRYPALRDECERQLALRA